MIIVLGLKFIASAAAVIFSGYRLCVYADNIAEALKIGRTFVGLMLLAVVTSLPELAVALSATRIGALDLALGDLFGSNLFNLTIVSVIFFILLKQPKKLSFDCSHFISLGFSLLLIALAALGIIFYNCFSPQISYSNIFLDLETILIIACYALGAYLVFRADQAAQAVPAPERSTRNKTKIWLKFIAFSAILVSSAVYLAHLGDQIARISVGGVALGGTFVGSLLIAIITSLPETSVAIAAVKLGFLDLALANIFGSNMFNMLIIPVIDLALGRKIVLSCVSSIHLFTIIFVFIISGLLMAGLIYRTKHKMPALAWDSIGILFVYFCANIVNFYLR